MFKEVPITEFKQFCDICGKQTEHGSTCWGCGADICDSEECLNIYFLKFSIFEKAHICKNCKPKIDKFIQDNGKTYKEMCKLESKVKKLQNVLFENYKKQFNCKFED